MLKYNNEVQTEELRGFPIGEVLECLGCNVKPDRGYHPRKNSLTQRIYVSMPNGSVTELLITGEKWYDNRANVGGGGAIDLVMHLYGETFMLAVQRLQIAVSGVLGGEIANPQAAPQLGRLAPVRSQQGDFFVADILDWMPKDDTASMEHPLFALKAGDKRVRVYERNGCKVTIKPSYDGCATIHDKDLWIYCISQLVAAKNQGREIGRKVRFTMYDFLRSTNRDTSGRAYQRASEMLERLRGTSITTNIVTPGYRERRGFGLVDSWRVVERDGDNRMVSVEVDLPNWLMCSIDAMQVLTLSRDYFRLRRPLDRRIYELARKHCGQQETWRASVAVLHEKSGSSAILRKFRFEVRALVESGELPDYLMAYDPQVDVVTFHRKRPVDKS